MQDKYLSTKTAVIIYLVTFIWAGLAWFSRTWLLMGWIVAGILLVITLIGELGKK